MLCEPVEFQEFEEDLERRQNQTQQGNGCGKAAENGQKFEDPHVNGQECEK